MRIEGTPLKITLNGLLCPGFTVVITLHAASQPVFSGEHSQQQLTRWMKFRPVINLNTGHVNWHQLSWKCALKKIDYISWCYLPFNKGMLLLIRLFVYSALIFDALCGSSSPFYRSSVHKKEDFWPMKVLWQRTSCFMLNCQILLIFSQIYCHMTSSFTEAWNFHDQSKKSQLHGGTFWCCLQINFSKRNNSKN